tara:strand:- start:353 stop:592 length:240 start_codon:yes stop_codon:yes gene_type:complete
MEDNKTKVQSDEIKRLKEEVEFLKEQRSERDEKDIDMKFQKSVRDIQQEGNRKSDRNIWIFIVVTIVLMGLFGIGLNDY